MRPPVEVIADTRTTPCGGLPRIRPSGTIRRVSRPKLAVHGHFYQPERRNPFTGEISPQPAAAPYRDWNARIDAECYKPNAERGNLRHVSYDLGPTLADWLADPRPLDPPGLRRLGPPGGLRHRPRRPLRPRYLRPGQGNAMAQAYHHAILPLASMADRRTEIRWGLRDFELRFGRRAHRHLAARDRGGSSRRCESSSTRASATRSWRRGRPPTPAWTHAGRTAWSWADGKSIVVVFYDAALSASASFESDATMNADSFARERCCPALAGAELRRRNAADRGHRHGRRAVRPPPEVPRPVPRPARQSGSGRARSRLRRHHGGSGRRRGRPGLFPPRRSPSGPRGAATTACCAGTPSARRSDGRWKGPLRVPWSGSRRR